MEWIIAVLVVALGGTLVVIWRAEKHPASSPLPSVVPSPPYDDSSIRSRLGELERQGDRLTLAVSEGISNVKRAENRINATLGRAKKEFAERGYESPALEAEYGELHALDGGGGEASELSGVPEVLVPPADAAGSQPSGVPGMTEAEYAAFKSGTG